VRTASGKEDQSKEKNKGPLIADWQHSKHDDEK
jgi:hypothetical protein